MVKVLGCGLITTGTDVCTETIVELAWIRTIDGGKTLELGTIEEHVWLSAE